MKHKWHKEIKAWADGAEIEFLDKDTGRWLTKMYDGWDIEAEYRIKPQPKEPQYLYVFDNGFDKYFTTNKCGGIIKTENPNARYEYIGKIKLED
jgi:hypothetical protein